MVHNSGALTTRAGARLPEDAEIGAYSGTGGRAYFLGNRRGCYDRREREKCKELGKKHLGTVLQPCSFACFYAFVFDASTQPRYAKPRTRAQVTVNDALASTALNYFGPCQFVPILHIYFEVQDFSLGVDVMNGSTCTPRYTSRLDLEEVAAHKNTSS